MASRLAGSGFGLMATSALALGPALIPLGAVGAAAIAGIGAAAVAGGSALAVFGATAKAQFTDMQTAAKGFSTIQQQVNKDAENVAIAKSAVANAKGTKELTAAQAKLSSASKTLANDQTKLSDAQDAFNKKFGPAAKGYENLTSAWDKWKKETSGPVLSILGQGMNILAVALLKLKPLFDLGAVAAQHFLTAMRGFVSGGGLDKVVSALTALGRLVIPLAEQSFRNLAKTAANLGWMLSSFAYMTVSALAKLTGALANWSGSAGAASGFRKFYDYVVANGPKVFALLAALAAAAVNIVRALAPLAPVSLVIATALAKLVAATPPGVITAIAAAFVAYSAAMKGLAVASAIGGIIVAIRGWIAAQWGLNVAMDANPLGAFVLAIEAAIAVVAIVTVLIVKYHKQIWAAVMPVWHDVTKAVSSAWATITGVFKTGAGVFAAAGSAVGGALAKVTAAFNGVKQWVSKNFDKWWTTHGAALKQVWTVAWNGIVGVFRGAWQVMSAVAAPYLAGLAKVVQVGITAVRVVLQGGMGAAVALWRAGWGTITAVTSAAWTVLTAVVKVAWAVIAGVVKVWLATITVTIKVAWAVITGIFNVFLDVITGHWRTAWTDIRNMVTAIGNAIRTYLGQLWNAIKGAASSSWNAMFGLLRNSASGFWGWIQGWGSKVTNLITRTIPAAFGRGAAAIGRAFSGIENAVQAPIRWVVKHALNPLISGFDWITSHIGLGKPIPQITGVADRRENPRLRRRRQAPDPRRSR